MTTIKPFLPQTAEHYQINDLPWNDLIDHVMPVLKPNSWKILCLILRKTLGWNKEADKLSYSQIIGGITDTGSSDRTISNSLDELIKGGYILVMNHGKEKSTLSYAPNPDFEIPSASKMLADETGAASKTLADKEAAASKMLASEDISASVLLADGQNVKESASKMQDTKEESLNPIVIIDNLTPSSNEEGGGTAATSPVKKPETIPKIEYTEFEHAFLAYFSAKRFKNPTQHKVIVNLVTTYGESEVDSLAEWAAKKGMGLGQAIPAIESALNNPKRSKNGVYQNGQHNNTRTTKHNVGVATGLGEWTKEDIAEFRAAGIPFADDG